MFVCFLGVIFIEQRTRRREKDGQPVKGHLVSDEGNENVGVNVVPETGKGHDNVGVNGVPETGSGHKRHGRDRKSVV